MATNPRDTKTTIHLSRYGKDFPTILTAMDGYVPLVPLVSRTVGYVHGLREDLGIPADRHASPPEGIPNFTLREYYSQQPRGIVLENAMRTGRFKGSVYFPKFSPHNAMTLGANLLALIGAGSLAEELFDFSESATTLGDIFDFYQSRLGIDIYTTGFESGFLPDMGAMDFRNLPISDEPIPKLSVLMIPRVSLGGIERYLAGSCRKNPVEIQLSFQGQAGSG
jgi:hypothetical protein